MSTREVTLRAPAVIVRHRPAQLFAATRSTGHMLSLVDRRRICMLPVPARPRARAHACRSGCDRQSAHVLQDAHQLLSNSINID